MRRCLALILAFGLGTALAADGPESANVRGESTTTRKRLAEAEQKILAGKSTDALDELQRILDDVGDDLVTADGKQFTSAHQYVHRFLAKLPATDLKRYRDRVEEPAAKLLARGQSLRDPALLHQLLDRYAMSRPAEDAILLLAELAHERGEFATAELYWRKLLPSAEPKYPAPRTKPADLEAKLIASAIQRGDKTTALRILEDFAKQHADAVGRVAGNTGNYSETLTALLNERRVESPNSSEGTWTTLGGAASRNGHVVGTLPRHWPSRPTWKTPIPTVVAGWKGKAGRPPSVGAVKSLALHPVVMNRTAYLADAGRVFAFDLRTGTRSLIFDATKIERPDLPASTFLIPSPIDADYSLTAADGKLVFRFGHPELFPNPDEGEPAILRPSVLVGLVPSAVGKSAEVIWKRFPPVPNDVPASWEGAPVVAEGELYAAFVRSDGGKTIHAIACYRGDAERPAWVTDLDEASSSYPRTRHEQLALAGRNLVFCSQTGVIAAVNAKTGKHAWAYRYPRIRQYAADGRHRDLSPPVFADGRVFVAPNDADHLYAFEAESGTPLWNDGSILVDHLIGAANGKVVAAIAGPQRGIRAYDAATGSCDFPNGWRNHDDPFLPSFGRGLLSDEYIAWPTSAALYTIRMSDGTVAAQPVRGPHGNLAYTNGVLLVATPTELWGYVVDSDVPEPPTSKPVIISMTIPLPEAKPESKAVVALLPAIGKTVKVERISVPSDSPALNVGELDERAGVYRIIRRTLDVTYAVDSNGRTAKLPVANPISATWIEDRVLLTTDRGVSLVEPFAPNVLWTRELDGIAAATPIAGGVLLRIGEHQLLALNRNTGETAWVLNSKRESKFTAFVVESSPRFLGIVSFGNHILVQRSNGARWLIDSRNGKVLQEAPTTERAWLDPPFVVDPHHALVADGPNKIALVSESGRPIWTRDLGREASLTGEPATVRRLSEDFFTVVRRNQGIELERLSSLDGSSRWREPAMLASSTFECESLAADRQFLFAPSVDRLIAFKLDTGRAAWSSNLPLSARWRAVPVRNRLFLYPAEAVSVEPVAPFRSFLRYPHPRRISGLFGTVADDYFARTVPILLFDPQSGELQQRLEVRAAGPVSVRVSADGAVLAVGGSIYRIH